MTETTHSIATFPHRENGVWLAGLLRAKGIPHQVTVVSQDDFDECDNEAPGTTHVYVSEPDAAIWNELIADASRPRGRASWQWAVDGLAVRRDATQVLAACANAPARYVVKCDDCKREMRRTDDLGESAAGGRCDDCRAS